jgi:alpha-ketoglutarate-dependent taurine dioxygenase
VPNAPVSLPYPSCSAESVRALLDSDGYVYVHDIPSGFDHAAFCARLGSIMPQYNGDLICSITPDEQYEHLDHPLTTHSLPPHTDGYEFDGIPPRYLALWCVVPPADGGGRTTLGDLYAFADTLSDEDRKQLLSRRFRFVSGIEDTPEPHAAMHPIFDERPDQPTISRFSHQFTEPADDPFLASVNGQVLEFFDASSVAIAYEANSLLLWDNFRLVHGRTGFEDRNRHLRRIWISES